MFYRNQFCTQHGLDMRDIENNVHFQRYTDDSGFLKSNVYL